MIQRLFPRSFDQTPFDIFSLLLIGQGFPDAATSYNTCAWGWNRSRMVQPLNLFDSGRDGAYALSVHVEDGAGLDLGLTQTGNQLILSQAGQQKLDAYLAATTVRDDSGRMYSASDVWGDSGRAGEIGAVIAIVVHNDAARPGPAELYQAIVGTGYRRPVVAVVTAGAWWHQVIARAVAQLYASLADEFELPGADYAEAPAAMWAQPPNLLYATPAQRAQLAAGQNPVTVLGADAFPRMWGVTAQSAPAFYGHPTDDVNPPAPHPPNGRVQVVEGAGFRKGAFRCDFDCLMRRQPNNAALPIQADVNLCYACRKTIQTGLQGKPGSALGHRRSRLNTQRIEYDKVKWSAPPTVVPLPTAPFTVTAAGPSGAPTWEFVATVDATNGLRIGSVKLKNRPGDPYKGAEDICEWIAFQDLSVSLDGGPPTPLAFADAFANTKQPPRLERATNGGLANEYLAGVKLALTWAHPSGWQIEGILGLVVKDKRTDFDPGGAAEACRFYPQLALRYVMPRVARGTKPKKLPKVTALAGKVVIRANNVIPTSLKPSLDPMLRDMANGMLAISLFTDTNSSDDDSTYDLAYDPTRSFAAWAGAEAGVAPSSPVGIWNGDWKQGRKLAEVVVASKLPSRTWAGASAREAHVSAGAPPLPNWSWLFDYCWPDFSAKKTFVGVYRAGETTSGGAQNTTREALVSWPAKGDQSGTPQPYTMTIRKLPRQGAYDNVHMNAAMMTDSLGRGIVAAPFCADLCMHLHWRWGTIAVENGLPSLMNVEKGWGDGMEDQGQGSTAGMPLIPPNQHLEVTAERPTMDRAQVTYAVTADRPGHREWQVILEQGLALAFTYNGLSAKNVALLGGGVGAVEFSPGNTYDGFVKTVPAGTPAGDMNRRMLFMTIYQRIRWYDPTIDQVGAAEVQQIPGWDRTTKANALPSLDAAGKALDLEAL